MVHLYNAGSTDTVIEAGDTQDGAYLAPSSKGLALHQPYRVATARGFVMADNAIFDTADFDTVVVFQNVVTGTAYDLWGRFNVTGGRREWNWYIDTNGFVHTRLSEDGSTTAIDAGYGGWVDPGGGWTAVRVAYDDSAGSLVWQQYDADAVITAATAAAVDATVAEIVAGLTIIDTETDSFTPFATGLHNGTSYMAVGGRTSGASDDSIVAPAACPVRYGKVTTDAGTVTFDPARDASAGATTFTDATSTLDWTLQTVTTQTDWPTLSGATATYDGADFAHLSYTPTVTATTGAMTIYQVITPAAGSTDGDRIVSSQSGAADGVWVAIDDGETTCTVGVGGASTSVEVTTPANLVAGTRASVAIVIDAGTVAAYENTGGLTATSSITGVGTITHAALMVGARANDDGIPFNGDIQAGTPMVFPSALTEAQLIELDTKFGL